MSEEYTEMYAQPRLSLVELKDLAVYLLRSDAVFQQAKSLLVPEYFDPVTEPHLVLLWTCLLEVEQKYQKFPVPQRSLRHTVVKYLKSDPELLPTELQWELLCSAEDDAGQLGLIDAAYAADEASLDDDEGLNLLRTFLEERAVLDEVQRALQTGPGMRPTNFRDLLEKVNQRVTQIHAVGHDPFLAPIPDEWYGEGRSPYTTGIPFIDELLGGGHAPGETVGFIAPYGVGKTLLATQLGVESAKFLQSAAGDQEEEPKRVFLISYEDPSVSLSSRVIAYAADISLQRLQGLKDYSTLSRRGKLLPYERRYFKQVKGVKDLSQQDGEYERLQKAKEIINRNLVLMDFASSSNCGHGMVDEIAAMLRRVRDERGWQPGCVIIDYVGKAVDRHIQFHNLNAESATRHLIRRFVDSARGKIAEELDTPVWLGHQFAGAVVNAAVTKDLGHSDAAECKSFGESLWFSLVLGNLEKESRVGRLRCTKSRRSGTEGEIVLVKRDGEFSRFHDARKSYIIDPVSGRIVSKDVAAGLSSEAPAFDSEKKARAAKELQSGLSPFFPPELQ